MIFEKLADFITRRAKLVLIIWVIVLLASVYPALHASEKLSYNVSSMGDDSSESIDGAMIMGKNFSSSSSDTSNIQMIVVSYTDDDASLLTTLDTNLQAIAALSDKITIVVQMGAIPDEHIVIYAVSYAESLTSQEVSNDTGNLRGYVADAVSATLASAGVSSSGIHTYVTGNPAVSYDAGQSMSRDLSIIDPFSILLILILVGLFFRSFVSSAAPPITIGVAFVLVLCALFFLGQVLEIFYITEMLLLVSMLGAGCDYCIFILARYREERRRGLEHIDACKEAITWAGESVFTSGLAVMIGFGAMMVCNFRIISYMGLGLAIGIVFALLAALTLMSSLLVILGDRLYWPTGAHGPKLERGYLKKMGHVAEVYFTKSTHFSIKHAKAIIIATVLFTVPMVYVYATSENSYDMIGAMMNGESQEGMQILINNGQGGAMMPNYAVYELSEPLGTVTYMDDDRKIGMLTWADADITASGSYYKAVQSACNDMVTTATSLDNVDYARFDAFSAGTVPLTMNWETVSATLKVQGIPTTTSINTALDKLMESGLVPAAAAAMIENVKLLMTAAGLADTSYADATVTKVMNWELFVAAGTMGVDNANYDETTKTVEIKYLSMSMATGEAPLANASIDTVGQFKTAMHNYVDSSTVMNAVWITGTAAVMVEISDMMSFEFLKIELTAIILIIILLFFVLKSYLTPLRSVITIFMSVIWTVAVTHLLFDNVLHAGVLWILPIILLVICLGLGMDYDILLTTRIREYHKNKGMTNDDAISQAVLHSGSVITICGLIMSGTFGTLMFSSTVMLQQMGFALFFAIIVDALIVRTYIVPAAMHLMGDWNWKGPRFLQKKELEREAARKAAEENAEGGLSTEQ